MAHDEVNRRSFVRRVVVAGVGAAGAGLVGTGLAGASRPVEKRVPAHPSPIADVSAPPHEVLEALEEICELLGSATTVARDPEALLEPAFA